ncbi:MAG: dihydroorotate dehydrogenase [Propionibacteriaceae bacterium]|nr:dihydroorotate dehydrogenase [Propionibacteriaceae bacterium]
MTVDLSVQLGDWSWRNPFTVASGTFAAGRPYADLWSQTATTGSADSLALSQAAPLSCLGALTTKGVSRQPWLGNTGLRMTETASGMLNSIGLQNPGVEAFCRDDLPWLARQQVPVIVNVSGHSEADYVAVIERLEQEPAVSAYELNISCPNVDCGGMSFGVDPVAAGRITALSRAATDRPLIVKLTPNVTDITVIARAVEAAGADALSLINTVAGLAIDRRRRQLVFERGVAGLSGPAIKPIALYAVARCHQAVNLPLIGMGGISQVEDVVDFILAGATAVAVGTATFTDPLTVPRLIRDLGQWCQDQGVTSLSELVGVAQLP